MKKNSYPKYWEKRYAKMSSELVYKVEATAKADFIEADDFGRYKPGTFLCGSCVVTVMYEDNIWTAHIFSEEHISLKMIEDIRKLYLPNNKTFVMVFGPREEERTEGYILYELPKNVEE